MQDTGSASQQFSFSASAILPPVPSFLIPPRAVDRVLLPRGMYAEAPKAAKAVKAAKALRSGKVSSRKW